jgi:basic amino acid/polyamine antiporter, APA family
LAVAAVFVLRSREPEAPRPFKALGYPVTPALFVAASAAIVINAFYSDLNRTLIGAGIILAGIPFYLLFRKRGG